MHNFLKTFFPNFSKSFTGRFLIWHIVAIALTYLLVVSGFDWQYFLSTRNHILNAIFFPAIVIGGLGVIFMWM